MNNPHATRVETVTCAKCDGRRVLRAFSHIDAGRCFACGGAGTVRVEIEPPVHGPALPPAPLKGKAVNLPSLPGARVYRDGAVFVVETIGEHGELRSTFGIRNGRVYVDSVCNGHVGAVCAGDPNGHPMQTTKAASLFARTTLRAELQAAYDAAR